MKSLPLFPHKYKIIGWIGFWPLLVLGFIQMLTDYTPDFLDVRIPKTIDTMGVSTNNLLNEILGLLLIGFGLILSFSKTKQEDEMIMSLRLKSLLIAVYVNYGLLALSMILFYDFTFLWAMSIHLYTVLIIFIIHFHWSLRQHNKAMDHEE